MGASGPAVFSSLFNCSELSDGSSSVPLKSFWIRVMVKCLDKEKGEGMVTEEKPCDCKDSSQRDTPVLK